MKIINIITVHYKNISSTKKLIKNILESNSKKYVSLIIVNNSNEDISTEELYLAVNNIDLDYKILTPEKNIYYWGGANFALDYLSKKNDKFPVWTIVCNNDILFDNQFFSQLISENPKDFPVIAPRIFSEENNRDQNPYLLTPLSLLYKIYFRLYILNKWITKIVYILGRTVNLMVIKQQKQRGGKKQKTIYAPHGACVIFSNYFFDNGGYLDTGFDMYGEEISTAEISRNLGMNITYMPDLIVLHEEHAATGDFKWKTHFDHAKSTFKHLFKTYSI